MRIGFSNSVRLEQEVDDLHEGVGTGTLLLNLAMRLPVNLTAASVNIDLIEGQEGRALPDVTNNPEEDDDGEGKAGLEETLGVVGLATVQRGEDGHVHLGNEYQYGHTETNPGSSNTESSLERDLVKSVALSLPGSAETDVGKADRAPSEKSGKTG